MSMFGSIATGVANNVATNSTNEYNRIINNETNRANYELAKQQNEWNIEQWRRENDYNDPSSQVQRLRDAGLSASAAAQNIEGAGNSSHLESANLSNQQSFQAVAPQFDFSGINILEEMRKYQALRTESANADKAREEANFTPTRLLTENDVQRAEAASKWFNVYRDSLQMPYTTRLLRYNARNAGLLGDKIKAETDSEKAIREEHKANADLLTQKYDFLKKYNDEQLNKIQREVEEINQRIKESQSRVDLNKANTALTETQTEGQELVNEGQKTKNVILDHEQLIKQYEECFARHGYPKDAASQCAALIADGIVPANNFEEAMRAARWYVETQGKFFGASRYGRIFLENVLESGIGADSDRSWRHAMDFFNMVQSGTQSLKNVNDTFMPKFDLPVPYKP